jgi:hypothetical protein
MQIGMLMSDNASMRPPYEPGSVGRSPRRRRRARRITPPSLRTPVARSFTECFTGGFTGEGDELGYVIYVQREWGV